MKTKRSQLFGETIREIGILLLVFAPLDAWLQRETHSPEGWGLAAIMVAALLLILYGIKLEVEE